MARGEHSLRERILPNVAAVPTPTILRGTYIHNLVRQVNTNTISINSPRDAQNEDEASAIAAALEQDKPTTIEDETGTLSPFPFKYWQELSRTESTVRVENPNDATQYVDVNRIETVTFIDNTGQTYVLTFDNS